jgi:hypothetical protein
MKVFVVLRNDKVEAVFQTQENADHFIKFVGGWNVWKIIQKDLL